VNVEDAQEAIRAFVLRELIRDEDLELALDEPIFSAGLVDSFSVTQLMCFLEDTFKVRISAAEVTLDDFDTVSRMLALLRRTAPSPRTR